MTDGSRVRRVAASIAAWSALIAVAPGCRPFPVRRGSDVDPAVLPTIAAQPAQMPPLPPTPGPPPPATPRVDWPSYDPILITASDAEASLAEAKRRSLAPSTLDRSVVRASAAMPPAGPDVIDSGSIELPAPAPAPLPLLAARGPLFPPPPAPADRAPSPQEAWAEALDRLRSLARDRGGEPDAAGPDWPIRAALLDGLGLDGDAKGGPAASLRKSLIAALAGRPEAAAAPSGEDVRRAVEAIEADAPAEIAALAWCKSIQGFGEFEPVGGDVPRFKPGQPLILYCEVSGVRYQADPESPSGPLRSQLVSTMEIAPAGGGPVALHKVEGIVDHCRRRRRDNFISYRFSLPDRLAAGRYELRLALTDELAGRGASRAIGFEVGP